MEYRNIPSTTVDGNQPEDEDDNEEDDDDE